MVFSNDLKIVYNVQGVVRKVITVKLHDFGTNIPQLIQFELHLGHIVKVLPIGAISDTTLELVPETV